MKEGTEQIQHNICKDKNDQKDISRNEEQGYMVRFAGTLHDPQVITRISKNEKRERLTLL